MALLRQVEEVLQHFIAYYINQQCFIEKRLCIIKNEILKNNQLNNEDNSIK